MIGKTDTDRIRQFFDKGAYGFDGIYTGQTYSLMRWLNTRFRKGIYMRHEATLTTCGDVTGKRILDVGCGSGRVAIDLALRGAHVVGIDFSDEMLEIAGKVAAERGVSERCEFIKGDFLKYKPAQPFDIVIALGLFDYTRDALPFLRKMCDCTPAMLIATFPKRWTPRSVVRRVRLALLKCPVYFYTLPQIDNLCRQACFSIERIESQANGYFAVARINH